MRFIDISPPTKRRPLKRTKVKLADNLPDLIRQSVEDVVAVAHSSNVVFGMDEWTELRGDKTVVCFAGATIYRRFPEMGLPEEKNEAWQKGFWANRRQFRALDEIRAREFHYAAWQFDCSIPAANHWPSGRELNVESFNESNLLGTCTYLLKLADWFEENLTPVSRLQAIVNNSLYWDHNEDNLGWGEYTDIPPEKHHNELVWPIMEFDESRYDWAKMSDALDVFANLSGFFEFCGGLVYSKSPINAEDRCLLRKIVAGVMPGADLSKPKAPPKSKKKAARWGVYLA